MRRSLHFVPGGNEKMIAKALTLPADGLILDLEDAVTPERKAATRPIVRGSSVWVSPSISISPSPLITTSPGASAGCG